jgi:subtilisin family serine protease
MAAPHVAGAAALVMADTPGQTLPTYITALVSTTVQGLPNPPNPDSCGGKSYNVYPNYIYGRGLLDALAAVNSLP